MAKLTFCKTQSGLLPLTPEDKETFDKWKVGSVISGDFKQLRSYKFHKKFFSLLTLAFDYYEPSSGVLTQDEKRIATKIFKELDQQSEGTGVLLDYGREFLKRESIERKSNIENIQKAFEPFREEMTIEAGYFDLVILPTGTKKVARSISFSKMDELEFRELYKAVFNVLWRFVLSRYFKDESEAEGAVEKMLQYA